MNLYLIKRTDEVCYDEYDAIVVAANNEEEALTINPGAGWPGAVSLECTLIGKAVKNIKGIVLASFCAG